MKADVIVVGGGPAGLSGAMMLARCRVRVVLFDTGIPRNATARSLHGYLTREGIRPMAWLALARAEALRFGVVIRNEEVGQVTPLARGFVVTTRAGRYRARKVLMATGVKDRLPERPGFASCYGISVFHCPYCDGWEVRDKALAVFAPRGKGAPLALKLRGWSTRVTLFTDAPPRLLPEQEAVLRRAKITVRTEPVRRLLHRRGHLQAVELATDDAVPCDALFFGHGHAATCGIMADLGCVHLRTGAVVTDRKQRTRVPGLFVAGDAAIDTHFVAVACAEGVKAAVAIHHELLVEKGWS